MRTELITYSTRIFVNLNDVKENIKERLEHSVFSRLFKENVRIKRFVYLYYTVNTVRHNLTLIRKNQPLFPT